MFRIRIRFFTDPDPTENLSTYRYLYGTGTDSEFSEL